MEVNLFQYTVFLLLGFSVGVLSGFFGVGGAFILTPTLNILGLPMANAVASGLAFTMGVSVIGAWKHYLLGNVVIKISLFVGFLTIIGLRISYPLVLLLDQLNAADVLIRFIYIFLLLSLALLTLRRKEEKPEEVQSYLGLLSQSFKRLPPQIKITQETQISLWSLLFIALFVGFLQGIMGVGGGFILVPLFILILDLKPHLAAGTSLGVIIISSIFGTYFYYTAGMIFPVIVFTLFIGSVFGVRYGTAAIRNIESNNLRIFYGAFLFLTSFGVVFKQLNWTILSLSYTLSLCFIVTILIILKYYLCYAVRIPLLDEKKKVEH